MPWIQRVFCRTAESRRSGKHARVATSWPSSPRTRRKRPSANRLDPHPELVVFGQAFRRKRRARCAIHPRDLGEHSALERAPDSGGRQGRRQRLAHHHRLSMRLGEFLAIVASDPARRGLRCGKHRDLDEVRTALVHSDRVIEQRERRRIDHVLGIVQHHHPERGPKPRFVHAQGAIEPVEAVGLGRWTFLVEYHDADTRVRPRAADRSRQGSGVVAITAAVNAQRRMRPHGASVGDGGRDDLVFLPCGDEHCDRAGEACPKGSLSIDLRGRRAAG